MGGESFIPRYHIINLCCSRNLVILHLDHYKTNLLVIPVLTCQYLCVLAKNSVSYAHFLFDTIFISEIAGGSRFMKKTIMRQPSNHMHFWMRLAVLLGKPLERVVRRARCHDPAASSARTRGARYTT